MKNTSSPVWLGRTGVHFGLLLLVTTFCVGQSWRRWVDLLVDFGRELYTPWRLSEGAVLYRDVDSFYGPLSQYFNAGLFTLFGPGLMVLVWANLILFGILVGVLYALVRRAWTPAAALAAVSLFIVVFGFAHYSTLGDHNYAAPYSHETTHGMVVVVLLVAAIDYWLRSPTTTASALVGIFSGLTLVLKPEFILASAALIVTAGLLFRRNGGAWRAKWIGVMLIGTAVPTLVFAIFFSRHMAAGEAWAAATRAWINVIGTADYISDPVQINYAGLDRPLLRVQQHALAIAIAVAVIGLMVVSVKMAARVRSKKGFTFAAIVAGAGIATGAMVVPLGFWVHAGRCLLGLVLAYAAYLAVALNRRENPAEEPRRILRLLLAVLGVTMMARMVLNGRIHQFGYYQAAVAAIVVVAWLCAELPSWVGSERRTQMLTVVCAGALLVPGAIRMWGISESRYRMKTDAVGAGVDRFYTYSKADPFLSLTSFLATRPRTETLLVLPEGLMVNYLVRMRSPLPPFFFYSVVTENGREAHWVQRLAANPPDWVATVKRDLLEYGIQTYGERPGAGKDILDWVKLNYVEAISMQPVEVKPGHIQLFQRRSGVVATPERR